MQETYCPIIQDMIRSNFSDRKASVGTVCLHGLVSAFGIFENVLILWVIGFRVPRSVLSIWILNLAASDLLATASLPFFTLYLAKGNTWILGTTFCKIHSSIFFLNMFVSGSLLAVISLDRCLVSLRPVWAQNYRDVRLAMAVCATLWVLAFLNTVPYYLFRDTIKRHDGRIICYYNFMQFFPPGGNATQLCATRQDAMSISKFFIAFLLPLLAIVGSYMAVSSSITRRGRKRTYRFFRLVVAVVVSFVLCWIPYHLFCLLEAVAHYRPELRRTVDLAMPPAASLAFINSVLNPVLYVFSCPDFLTKIRQSLASVMESVLVEDMADACYRRSTARSSVSTSELLHRGQMVCVNPGHGRSGDGEEEHPAVF
ncbi:prostaglandin D2 receptor 2-like [Scleropages formosus]|uniref:Prostaglandin D2 receptor 2 n=1 Tax=Scleropages formosus TaxID=113540 RepID=A0A0P7VEG8_SCLFO|nr:prostaglandin D2 receptor 2 [Scleropages formosus]XP_018599918.1 prostaglandin D2 receptor 2 [Scleropages formosus]KPP80183.1 prostaglandin D2 receptor 2-like [Scleropages formosus]